MPHAELKFSADLGIDAPAVLARIEAIIQTRDAGSGECKGRAYPAAEFHHSHLLADISLLRKSHRDAAFMRALTDDLEVAIKAMIPVACFFSLNLHFSSETYVTNRHEP
ncbi:hypothetical protein [uncultured Tateyamaria sp.]|uniref:hypothetical protein n=1 Tax=uncultured Tateyamaria sp. TaxID=455651 RepID=UPI00260C4323|nr:hypothetical protein [uncultured Tateyamaria sp.]